MITSKKHKTLSFINVLRFLAFVVIYLYHFMYDVDIHGICPLYHRYGHFLQAGNISWITTTVSLFFLISGTCLTISIQEKEQRMTQKDLWLDYYKNRFSRILITYYIAYLICQPLYYATYKKIPVIQTKFPLQLFTLLGIDEYLKANGINTASIGIGEWFLGALILIYIVFPLLYILKKKHPVIIFILFTSAWILLLKFYPFSFPPNMNILVKAYDFVIGMYLSKITTHKLRPLLLLIPILILFTGIFKISLFFSIDTNFWATLTSSAIFIIFCYLEPWFKKLKLLNAFCKKFCSYSYEFYLLHHLPMYFWDGFYDHQVISRKMSLLLLLTEGLTMIVMVYFVKGISERMIKYIN